MLHTQLFALHYIASHYTTLHGYMVHYMVHYLVVRTCIVRQLMARLRLLHGPAAAFMIPRDPESTCAAAAASWPPSPHSDTVFMRSPSIDASSLNLTLF